MTGDSQPTVVDALGVLCPVPIIRLARAAAGLPAGSVIELVTDDPVACVDVPAWCHLRGHELLAVEDAATEAGQALRHRIRLRSRSGGPPRP